MPNELSRIWTGPKLRYRYLDKKLLLSLQHRLYHDLRGPEIYFFLNSDTGNKRYEGNEYLTRS
jgi:hypothetical protein